MQRYIQEKYNFSNYQMKQLAYVLKTILAETSKIIILLILFHNNILQCLYTILLLSLLRTSAGGIHFHSYWSCLIATIVFFALNILILPNIPFPEHIEICLLCACGIINYKYAPITAPGHIELPISTIHRSKLKAFATIEIYAAILYILPRNQYIQIGFWIIIIHTLQLIIAKIKQT